MKSLIVVALVAGLALLSSPGVAGEGEVDLSSKQEDAFILYKYSMLDAKRSGPSKISASTEGNKVTYQYDGHALSCSTVMTGYISGANQAEVIGRRRREAEDHAAHVLLAQVTDREVDRTTEPQVGRLASEGRGRLVGEHTG